jgi:hypothetical protein
MTTKPPSGLAASGTANDPDPEQITREQNEDGRDINVDPSEDVTVEATEDVTSEAASHTPPPQARPGTVGVSPGQRAPTLLGVPIASLPLPGVTSASENEDATRTIDYNEEVTVLAQPSPNDPMAVLDAFDRPSFTDDLDRPSITDDDEEETKDARPSITDDDEEETKVEPADAAMKAAASVDDVSTALSAQASVEREKALRRAAPSLSASDDLEFADPEADDDRDENIDDDLDDDDEIISAGGAIEEEEDDVGEALDGVATATFMKPADTTGLSGLLNPRRPPTGGRDGFGSRLPTPYPPPQSPIPGPSTSPFASRLGPAPIGSPYAGRATGAAMPAIQVPPPSGKATTETGPGFLAKQVPMVGVMLLCFGFFVAGFGIRGLGGKSAPAPAVVVAKPVATSPAPAVVVEPVQAGQPAVNPAPKAADPTAVAKPATPPATDPLPAGTEPAGDNPEAGMSRPAKKPIATAKPHKPPVDMATDEGDGAAAKQKPAIAKEPKPPATGATAVAKEAKPAVTKPAKKPAKAWVDPFAN